MQATPDLITLLSAIGKLRSSVYKKNEVILRPQEDDDRFFIVRKGLVKAYNINSQGEEEVQLLYTTGEAFPISWMASRPMASLFFETISDCEIAYMARADVAELLDQNPQLAKCMLEHVVNQFVIYAARVHNLSYKYSRERLAYRLLLMAKRFGTRIAQGISLPLISQQDIGAAINLSRESVNRGLARFEHLGIIIHHKGRIIIIKPEQLRKEIKAEAGELYFD